ncbi:hypothetical protein O6H91_18G005900 [Diphasiastrum complanatum]|uniref:Uncharacterized protein n=1 Tax=Diphasiastrum complanatum TaxID=34168 RepID=A0ACC2AXR3_DIPCM|nr:hypothetical protein O6H91_18G005900 [Diphasiastrum complanatum]
MIWEWSQKHSDVIGDRGIRMEPREALQRNTSSETKGKGGLGSQMQAKDLQDNVKVIDWLNFENSLANLCGTAKVLARARLEKEALAQKLETSLEARSKSLRRVDNLEFLQKELESRKLRLESLKISLEKNIKQVAKDRELLLPSAQSLLISSRALISAQGRVQEANRLLAGEGGYLHLIQLRKLLFIRRCFMVAQVAVLYPLARCNCAGIAATKYACSSRKHFSDDESTSKRGNLPLNILGLHILTPRIEASRLSVDKQNHEGTATALGYVAHVVLLVASYLDVHLRYPIRFGASCSYVQDYSPANERRMIMEPSTVVPLGEGTPNSAVEFPLFSKGQDLTRAAYAIYLLNKDLEQLLNSLGVESVGPRHTLSNLHKVLSTIFSGKKSLV